MKFASILTLAIALAGCAAPGSPPGPILVIGVAVGVTEAKRLVITKLAPRVEAAYKAGKLTKDQYLVAREEEAAALKTLDGLLDRISKGEPITQKDLDQTLASFVTPLIGLVGTGDELPPAQP